MTDNELIAEFFAAKKHLSERGRMSYLLIGVPAGFDRSTWYESGATRFHESWDWLMPVILKIEGLYSKAFPPGSEFVSRILAGDKISEIIDRHYMDVIAQPLSTPIAEVYESVVAFIKWYNAEGNPQK